MRVSIKFFQIMFLLLCLGIISAFSPKAIAQARIDPNKAFRIASLVSGLCWDVPSSRFVAGTRLQQFPCHVNENQQWRIEGIQTQANGNIDGLIIRTVGGNASLCVTKNNTNNLELQQCPPSSSVTRELPKVWSMREVILSNNNSRSIRLINKQNNQCADVPSGNLNPTNLNTFECNDGANQAWVLLPMTP